MTDLERRALLGDKQAQEECTRQGIVLPCPFCGRSKETVFKLAHSNLYAHKRTGKCALDGMIIYNLADWNTRPTPPIGRCKDCIFPERWENGEGICPINNYVGICEDDFCNVFEPKGK